MPKIPRSRDYYETFKPSAAPEIPMGLADYSAWSDALDKGAAFAAKKYHQKNNEEAKLAINAYANFAAETGAEYERMPYEDSTLQSGGRPVPLAERSEKRNSDFERALKSRLPDSDNWSSANRIALEAVTQNVTSMNRSKTKLLESKTLVAAHQANYSKWEENTLKRIRSINPGDNLDKIFREAKGSWDLRLEDANAGGLMENPKQVQESKLAFDSRVVKALFERYEGVWFSRMDESSMTTTSDLESTITDSMSDQERKAAGVYGSYMEFYRDVKNNGRIAGYDINALSPDKSNLELAKESHDRIFGRLTKNRVARKTAATANFNAVFNGYMDRATNEQRDFNEIEMNHIKASANAAGVRLSSHFFNFRKNAQSKPTLAQEHNNSLLEYEFEKIKTDALNRDVEPDFTAFTLRVVKEYDAGFLHLSDMKSAFKELGIARTAKGKRINEDVKTITDLFMKEYVPVSKISKSGRKKLGRGPKSIDELGFYEGYNAEMTGDIRPVIRAAVMRAHASGKTVEPQTIYNEVVSHIRRVRKNMNPLKINISQEELEPILQKRREGGALDDDEQLIYDLSLAKMGRNSRFKRAAKKFMASASSLSGASLADKKKFALEYKDELSFLMPGGYDIEDLHNKYRRRVDSAKPKEGVEATIAQPKEGAGTTAQPKEAIGDESGDTKLPVSKDTGEKSFDEMTPDEFLAAFKKNPKKVWDGVPEGVVKDMLRGLLEAHGLDEEGSVVKPEKIKLEKKKPRKPVDSKDVKTQRADGQFRTDAEEEAFQKEAVIQKSAVVETARDVYKVGESAVKEVSDQFAALSATKKKGPKAVAKYKAERFPDKYPFWKFQKLVGELVEVGYDKLANELSEELDALIVVFGGDVKPKSKSKPKSKPVSDAKKLSFLSQQQLDNLSDDVASGANTDYTMKEVENELDKRGLKDW